MAATPRTRAGGLGSHFTASRPMAHVFELRAAILPGEMRKAHGKNGSLVYRSRKRIMRQTIYERPPTDRPLTGLLYASERIQMAGSTIRLTNLARYAKWRHKMSGISVMYGHLLDSFWAGRAMQHTASARARNLREALRRVWRTRR